MAARWNLFSPPQTPAERWLIWATTAIALTVPGIVGAVVKLQLDAIGKPTLTWVWGATGMIPITIAVAMGWLIYALTLRWMMHRCAGRQLVVTALEWGWAFGLIGGTYAVVPALHELLQDAAIAMMIATLAPYVYWKYVLGGGLAAAAVGYGVRWLIGPTWRRQQFPGP